MPSLSDGCLNRGKSIKELNRIELVKKCYEREFSQKNAAK